MHFCLHEVFCSDLTRCRIGGATLRISLAFAELHLVKHRHISSRHGGLPDTAAFSTAAHYFLSRTVPQRHKRRKVGGPVKLIRYTRLEEPLLVVSVLNSP
jgi:hypothetical protein